jgi:hypothetical protein
LYFYLKKKGAQITGTKSVRGDDLSGTKTLYQVQKYFFPASCSTAGWNLEKPKGAVSVDHVDVGPGTKKMQFSRTKRTF